MKLQEESINRALHSKGLSESKKHPINVGVGWSRYCGDKESVKNTPKAKNKLPPDPDIPLCG